MFDSLPAETYSQKRKAGGWVEYKEGWFEIRRSEATAESTLCGMQIHYGDQRIDPFPTDEWKLIERPQTRGMELPIAVAGS